MCPCVLSGTEMKKKKKNYWLFFLMFWKKGIILCCTYFLILYRGNFIVKLWFGCNFFLGAKLSGAILSVLLCWCQIVRVPNCPGAKLSVAKLSCAKLSYHHPSSQVPKLLLAQICGGPNSRWPKFVVAQSVVAKIDAVHGGQVWNREPRYNWNYYRTRLTYNCAHLRSTKESLTFEYHI